MKGETTFNREEFTRILLMTLETHPTFGTVDEFALAVGRMSLNYATLRWRLAQGVDFIGPDGSGTSVRLDVDDGLLKLTHRFPPE